MFSSYEEDYSSLVASLGDKLGSLAKETGEERKVAVAQFERELAEAQDLIKSMDLAARGTAPAEKAKLQARLDAIETEKLRAAEAAKAKEESKAAIAAAMR